jgi:hypothetical protein
VILVNKAGRGGGALMVFLKCFLLLFRTGDPSQAKSSFSLLKSSSFSSCLFGVRVCLGFWVCMVGWLA